MSAEVLPPSVPPPTVAQRPHLAALIGLLAIGVASVFLSSVVAGKVHLHIVWETKQIDKVTELASAPLLQPSIQPTLQRGSYSQKVVLRSIDSDSGWLAARPAASAPFILTRPTLLSLPLPHATTPRLGQQQKAKQKQQKRQKQTNKLAGKSPARNSKTKVARQMKGSGAQALESLAESSMEGALLTLNQVKTIQRDFKTTRSTDNVTTPQVDNRTFQRANVSRHQLKSTVEVNQIHAYNASEAIPGQVLQHAPWGSVEGSLDLHLKHTPLQGAPLPKRGPRGLKSPFVPTQPMQPLLTAVLISGQRTRFMFQDSNFVLKSPSHVFIVLQDWDFLPPRQWTGPDPIRPPYDVESDNIKSHYLSRGAGLVQVKMVRLPEMHKWQQIVGEAANLTFYTDNDRMRYASNANMLILRHLVFQDMLRSETQLGVRYGRIIFMREDSVFLPFGDAISPHFLPQEAQNECSFSLGASPCVLGTKTCSFGHGISDKMFYANSRGADVLFAKTLQDFLRGICSWIGNAKKGRFPATERFYKTWLDESGVRLEW
eukprot:CAMPEP_0179409516 /NCGR_PEP_ID=MMETSP0799-20121207/2746_1 /TAXON_ID=46947 /ORGANISM="Geminigera cryophila, Strain CCMP2564" /LENGTH=543 /DNA_ID=CAMNT_0021181205 /DNA_START=568 /DNA_END=2196 /DNA_ORIENTATION=-